MIAFYEGYLAAAGSRPAGSGGLRISRSSPYPFASQEHTQWQEGFASYFLDLEHWRVGFPRRTA